MAVVTFDDEELCATQSHPYLSLRCLHCEPRGFVTVSDSVCSRMLPNSLINNNHKESCAEEQLENILPEIGVRDGRNVVA